MGIPGVSMKILSMQLTYATRSAAHLTSVLRP